MPSTVAFFNHKGGVGKTTLIFNVGLAVAATGSRVLFIDADAQANLTALALPPDGVEAVYKQRDTISDYFGPLVDGSGDIANPRPVEIRDNAWIVPGHIMLSEYEGICPTSWTEALAGQKRGLRVTTAPFRLAQNAAAAVGADLVIFDVGPNVGALNRNILLACGGFVVPLAPDLFSLSALDSVGRSVAAWTTEWRIVVNSARETEIPYPLGSPSPLGYISQQFATYRQAPAEAYRRWLSEIPDTYRNHVVEPLRRVGISIPFGNDKIGEVRNLSSLVPIAQRGNAAIFELGGSEARGAQYTRARDTFEEFSRIGTEIVARLDAVGA